MATHRFTPDHYHNTIGSHPPVLRIAPGDTVITTTIDAMGYDAQRVKVTEKPNPMTGPFYVEGAEPGDMLVMRLDRLQPSRPTGDADSVLATNTVPHWFVPQLPLEEAEADVVWEVNYEQRTTRLVEPFGRLGHLPLPMEIMTGCFGVAPALGQAISTMTCGDYGGNTDYKGFTEGVTVYFPVFMPGALIFIGDGHARQADGEISGSGIEISMEVEFTVDLVKNHRIRWPRGENADYIFAIGCGLPLDQALQFATSEMLRWLQEDYGFTKREANLLLGYAGEYDLGNIYNPAYSMVCKLRKSYIPQ
jgi:amidase